MFKRRKRIAAACMASLMVCAAVTVALSTVLTQAGAASITQPNGCASNIPPNGMTQINMGIAATASPNPVTVPGTTSLTGVVVTFAVSQSLLAAGIAVGVVTAAPDLANLGNAQINNPPDGLTTDNGNAGILAANVAAGGGKLMINGSEHRGGHRRPRRTPSRSRRRSTSPLT